MNDRAFSAEQVLAGGCLEHPTPSFCNPLGYWCAPNGCTPDYASSQNFHVFLAYGLLRCWIDQKDVSIPYTNEDIQTARKQFLNTVENALEHMDDFERDKRYTQDEPVEPRLYLDAPNDELVCANWTLDLIANDGDLCFTWAWTGCDDFSIWLSGSCVKTRGRRRKCIAAVRMARQVITNLKGETIAHTA